MTTPKKTHVAMKKLAAAVAKSKELALKLTAMQARIAELAQMVAEGMKKKS